MTRPTKWRTRATILLSAMGPLLLLSDRGAHVNGQTTVDPRWGQSSFLLSPNSSSPTLIIISGKTYVAGQTDSSTPSISTSLSLSLSSPILDLTSPPWTTLNSSPVTSYSCSIPLSSTTGLIFGGDATGDDAEPIQTLNDSSYLVSFSDSTTPLFTQEVLGWENEPLRRQNAVSISATNGTLTRSWIYGGMKADGSGIAFDDLWEFRNHLDSDGGIVLDEGDGWGFYEGMDGPPALYDGVAVLVPSSTSTSSPPSIYIFGGVQVVSNTPSLAPLDQIWIFTPSSSLASGSWKTITTTNAPRGRRGFVGVGIGEGKFWIQGGRNLDGDEVYGNSWMLDVEEGSGSWVEMSNEGVKRWGHSAVIVGETVVMAFGYGADQPAATTLEIYAPGNDSYLTSYYPFFVIDDSPSSSSSSSSAVTALASTGIDATATLSTSPPANPTSNPTSSSSGAGTSVFGSANTAGDAAISTAGWSVPGGVASSCAATNTPTSGSSNASGSGSSSNSSSGSSTPPTTQKIVGGVVGGILGSLMLGVGAVLLIRRSRAQSAQYGHYQDESWHFINGGSGGGGAVGSCPSYGGGTVEKALPVKMRGTNSARITFSSLWKGAVGGVGERGRRFDMLQDEDAFSEKYDFEGGDAGRYGWTHFDRDREEEERDAMGQAGPSTASSYFALGGIPRREQPYSSLFDVEAASNIALAPIAEWEEQNDLETTSTSSIRELQSAESHASAVPSADTSTNRSSNPPSTPSSFPSSSKSTEPTSVALFASGSSPSPNRRASLLAANMDIPSKMSRSSSTNSENRKSLWWGRLSKSAASSHDNQHDRIRDPAPPPILDAITEVSNSRRGWSGTDEQGQLSAREEGHHHSHSSGVSMRTATSWQLEERMRGMDVIQRMRTESEQSFAGTFGQREEELGLGDFGQMPLTEEPEHDIATPQTGAVIWRGDNTFDATPPQDPFVDTLPLPILPPIAARSPSPSSRKLHGPRPAPLPAIITQNLPSSSSSPALSDLSERPATAGVVGVRAMVQKFEQRKATLISSPSSTSPVAGSPSLPNIQSLGTLATDRRSSKVVDHGLAKKPLLFVANPDS